MNALRDELLHEAEEKDTVVEKLRKDLREQKDKMRRSYVPLEEHQQLAEEHTRLLAALEDKEQELSLVTQENSLLKSKVEKRKESYNKS